MSILHDRRAQSIAAILVVALVAIVGFLLIMRQMAGPEAAPLDDGPPEIEQPSAEIDPLKEEKNNVDDVVATVNEQTISKADWEKATRLDAVLNRLAGQPVATAEETLDRLVYEIIVLAGGSENSPPSMEEIEAKTLALQQTWAVDDADIVAALNEAGLTRDDLYERVGRLIRVEAALKQLAAQEDDLNAWLVEARTSAEVGLYRPLVSAPPSTEPEQTQATPPVEPATAEEIAAVGQESAGFAPPADMPSAPYVDNAAPDFTLPQLKGEPLTLSHLRGQPTIVNFWASWCPPCRRELPALQAAYAAHQNEIGFIAVDVKEDPGTISAFVEELGLDFPIALDRDGTVSDITYEVRGIPTTIFVDANGVVAARHVGPLDEPTIESYLAPLLEQADRLAGGAIDAKPANNETSPAVTMITRDSAEEMVPGDTQAAEDNPQPAAVDPNETDVAPRFTLTSGTGQTVSLQDYRGQNNVVLVFYRGHT